MSEPKICETCAADCGLGPDGVCHEWHERVTCGAVARFTYHGKPVVCCAPAGHDGNHLSANVGAVPISWREGRTIKGDIGPAIDADMRRAFEPIAGARKDGKL